MSYCFPSTLLNSCQTSTTLYPPLVQKLNIFNWGKKTESCIGTSDVSRKCFWEETISVRCLRNTLWKATRNGSLHEPYRILSIMQMDILTGTDRLWNLEARGMERSILWSDRIAATNTSYQLISFSFATFDKIRIEGTSGGSCADLFLPSLTQIMPAGRRLSGLRSVNTWGADATVPVVIYFVADHRKKKPQRRRTCRYKADWNDRSYRSQILENASPHALLTMVTHTESPMVD